MPQPATALETPVRSPEGWLRRRLAPWADALAERLAMRGACAAVAGPAGSGRGLLARMAAEASGRGTRVLWVGGGSSRGKGTPARRLRLACSADPAREERVVVVEGLDLLVDEEWEEVLPSLTGLGRREGLRLLACLDPARRLGLGALVEEAFDLRLEVPAATPAEVEELLRERCCEEALAELPPEAADRAMTLTRGRMRRLVRFVDSWLLARAVARHLPPGCDAVDAYWWHGRELDPALARILVAAGADDFFSDARGGGTFDAASNGAPPDEAPRSEDPESRRQAVRAAVGRRGVSREWQRRRILAGLCDENAGVRKTAIYALLDLGDGEMASSLIPLVRDGSVQDRRAALHVLSRLDPEGSRRYLVEALEDPNAEVRQTAAGALASTGCKEAVPELLRRLTDPNPGVRMSAESALARLAESEGPRPFRRALRCDDVRVRTGAAKVAGLVGLEDLRDDLREALGDEGAAVRRYSAESLGQIGGPDEVPDLLVRMVDPDAAVREAAGDAVARASGRALGEVLVECLAAGEDEIRGLAGRILGERKPRGAVEALIGLLDHPVPAVRQEAAALLGRVGDERAIEPLLRCHERDWPEVGRVVSASLVRLGVDGAADLGGEPA